MRRLAGVLSLSLLLSATPVFADTQGMEVSLHAWLVRLRSATTGLVQSFETSDAALRHQASTYDQALAGMAFLQMGDIASARRILEFFDAKWNGQGFANFYHTQTGLPGIETTVHVGPTAWIGLLALAYELRTGSSQYRRLAEAIALWIAGLNHRQGGVAMGPRADWGADWPRVYSSENNLSYLALLDGLLRVRGANGAHAARFEAERAGILRFLKTITFRDLSHGRVNSGLNARGVDTTQAFDVIPMALLIVTPTRLRAMGLDPHALVRCAEQHFSVTQGTIRGFDFTDRTGAFQAKRQRMISVEWTAMMIRAYRMLAEETDRSQARTLQVQATLLQQGLDQLRQRPTPDGTCYPYATRSKTQVFPFAPWWRTPAPGPIGPACSVAGTTWRYFAERWNPFEWDFR